MTNGAPYVAIKDAYDKPKEGEDTIELVMALDRQIFDDYPEWMRFYRPRIAGEFGEKEKDFPEVEYRYVCVERVSEGVRIRRAVRLGAIDPTQHGWVIESGFSQN